MSSNGLFVVVDPPRATVPRGATIVRSANPVVEADPHWIAGLRWRPYVCGSSAIDKAILVCGGAFSGFTTLSPSSPVDYVPPSIAAGIPCSAISGVEELNDTRRRAIDLLDRCETLGIARELWTGTAAQAENPDLPNDYLSNAATVVTLSAVATAMLDAFAALEEAVATAACGGVGMIHATVQAVTIWQFMHLIERQADGRLLSALGTVVVADPGYDGSAPGGAVDASGATSWAYGTGMIDLRRGPVQVLPPEGTLVSGINRTNNDFNVYATRPFAATFDPCTHVGIKLNHAVRD